jgi:hypothetical protein
MHVVRDRPRVVEELRVNRPFLVFRPDGLADEEASALLYRPPKREAVLAHNNVAESLIGSSTGAGGRSRGGKPALVDAAAIQPIGIEVIGMKFETPTRPKRARNPARGKTNNPPVAKLGLDSPRAFLDCSEPSASPSQA